MSYLALANRILHNELTEEELIDCLNIPNVLVVQYAILKIIEKRLATQMCVISFWTIVNVWIAGLRFWRC